MFKDRAELYFDLIMSLSQKHNISTVSMVSNMLRNCKNYSHSGKHHDALDEVVRCIKSLNFSIQLSENHKKMDRQSHKKNNKMETFRYHSRNFWLVVYISYYNMACELEFLKRISESLTYFEKAKRVLRNELGHQLPFKSIQQYLVQVPFFQTQAPKVSRQYKNVFAFSPSSKNSKSRQKSRQQSAGSRGSFTNLSM